MTTLEDHSLLDRCKTLIEQVHFQQQASVAQIHAAKLQIEQANRRLCESANCWPRHMGGQR